MDAELVIWVLLAAAVVVIVVLAVVVLGHVRRLGREQSAAAADLTRRLARLQLLRATRSRH